MTRLTTSADSIRMPHLPALSAEESTSAASWRNEAQKGEERTEARLVGEHVSRDKRRIGGERLRALVDVEEGPDAVAGAVL